MYCLSYQPPGGKNIMYAYTQVTFEPRPGHTCSFLLHFFSRPGISKLAFALPGNISASGKPWTTQCTDELIPLAGEKSMRIQWRRLTIDDDNMSLLAVRDRWRLERGINAQQSLRCKQKSLKENNVVAYKFVNNCIRSLIIVQVKMI